MNEFMSTVADIIALYRKKLQHYDFLPAKRLELMKQMQAELMLMKQTYELINGKLKPEDIAFEMMAAGLEG